MRIAHHDDTRPGIIRVVNLDPPDGKRGTGVWTFWGRLKANGAAEWRECSARDLS